MFVGLQLKLSKCTTYNSVIMVLDSIWFNLFICNRHVQNQFLTYLLSTDFLTFLLHRAQCFFFEKFPYASQDRTHALHMCYVFPLSVVKVFMLLLHVWEFFQEKSCEDEANIRFKIDLRINWRKNWFFEFSFKKITCFSLPNS